MAKKDRITSRMKVGMLFLILVGGFGIAILWSTIKVMWVDGDEWRKYADELSKDYKTMKAHRGDIYSSDGQVLATTVPDCDLYLDFSRHPERDKQGKVKYKKGTKDTLFTTSIVDSNYYKYVDSVCIILHEAFPDSSVTTFRSILDSARFGKKMKKYRGCAKIKLHVPYSDWDKICKMPGWRHGVVKEREVIKVRNGVEYRERESVIHDTRSHTYGNLAESSIGFYIPKEKRYTGLEGYYDSILSGHDGKVLCRRLTRGSWIPMRSGGNITVSDTIRTDSVPGFPVIDGQSIVATIDTRLQDIAHYSLEKALTRYGSSAGCAILIEAATGNVLVCSSLILDTADKSGIKYKEMPYRNVAVTDLYEPGSIFKPVLLTAMYNDPSFTLDTSMLLPVGQKRFSMNSKVVMDHGLPNAMYPLWKAVAVSSNVAFCELAWRFYGSRRDSLFAQVSRVFPFKNLDLDIVNAENKCITHSLRYDNDFLRFCYGYITAVSPLRMATFYNALANKGKMVKPRFCKGVIVDGELEELPVQVINEHICSEKTAETLRDMLIGVVEEGTGDNIKNDTYAIAGKTGTAVTSPNAPTSNATFVGFFPADKPKYTCLVMMRDIRLFGRNAAPVFQEIADCVVSLDKELDCRPTMMKLGEIKKNQKGSKGMQYTLPTVTKAPQAEVRLVQRRLGLDRSNVTTQSVWCTFRDGVDSLNQRAEYIKYDAPQRQVPNCYGMTIKDALLLCRGLGIDVTFEGYGKVVEQTPKAKTPITKGMRVHLKLKAK